MKADIIPPSRYMNENRTTSFVNPERAVSNVVHNTGTLIVMYEKPAAPSGSTDWWLLTECLMLAVYAIAATVWIVISS